MFRKALFYWFEGCPLKAVQEMVPCSVPMTRPGFAETLLSMTQAIGKLPFLSPTWPEGKTRKGLACSEQLPEGRKSRPLPTFASRLRPNAYRRPDSGKRTQSPGRFLHDPLNKFGGIRVFRQRGRLP